MVFTAEEEGDGVILLPELYGMGPGLGIDDSGHGSTTGLDMDAWTAEPLTTDLLGGDHTSFMETMTAYLQGQHRDEEADEGARAAEDSSSRTRKVATTTRRTSGRTVIKKEPGGPTSSALGGAVLGGGASSMGSNSAPTGLSSSLGSTGGGRGPLSARSKGPTLMQHSCEACKLSKKKCNRQNPCQVCLFRGIPCIPQDRGPGRPPGSRTRQASSSSSFGSRGSNLSDLAEEAPSLGRLRSSCSTSSLASGTSPRQSSRVQQQQQAAQQQGKQAQEQAQVLPSSTSSPALMGGGGGGAPRLSRPVLEALHHMKGALMEVWGEGDLAVGKSMELRSLWRRINQRFSVDVSVGLCEQVDAALGHFSMLPPAAATPLYSTSSSSSSDSKPGGGQHLRHPTNASDGSGVYHCLPDFLRKLDDGVSMLVGYVHSKDEFHTFANDRFVQTFMAADELAAAFENYGVIPDLLLSQLFEREDLGEVYGALGKFWFGQADPDIEEMAVHCQCVDRNGDKFLALVRYRHHLAKPDGYPAAAIMSIRPFSTPSKYLRSSASDDQLLMAGLDDTNVSNHGSTSSGTTASSMVVGPPTSSIASSSPRAGGVLGGSRSKSSIVGGSTGDGGHHDHRFPPLRRGLSVLTEHSTAPMRIPGGPPGGVSPDSSTHEDDDQQQHLLLPPPPPTSGRDAIMAQSYQPPHHHHPSYHHHHHHQAQQQHHPHQALPSQQHHHQQLSRQYASAPPVPGLHFPEFMAYGGDTTATAATADATGGGDMQEEEEEDDHHPHHQHQSDFHHQASQHHHHHGPSTASSSSFGAVPHHEQGGGSSSGGSSSRVLMDEAFYSGASGALFFKGTGEEDLPDDLKHDEIFSDHGDDPEEAAMVVDMIQGWPSSSSSSASTHNTNTTTTTTTTTTAVPPEQPPSQPPPPSSSAIQAHHGGTATGDHHHHHHHHHHHQHLLVSGGGGGGGEDEHSMMS